MFNPSDIRATHGWMACALPGQGFPVSGVDELRERLPAEVGILGSQGGQTELECRTELRYLPGRRLVCRAVWQGSDVIVKIFTGARARRDHALELRGARLLQDRDILAPRLVHVGLLLDQDARVVLYEEIPGARPLQDVWDEAVEMSTRAELLRNAVATLARHHNSGILQADLHLRNFLVAQGRIHTIDAADMAEFKGPVPMRKAVGNLAALLSQMYVEDESVHAGMFEHYEHCRGLVHSRRHYARLQRSICRWRRRLKRNLYNKIYRDCTAFVYRRIEGGRLICRRTAWNGRLREYLEDIDLRFDAECSQFLKQGRSSTVCRVAPGGTELVVKRYNVKSVLRSLRRAFQTSRASRTWRNTHNLLFYGIATAPPVALIERRSGLLPGVSYFVSEYVAGDNARDYFARTDPGSPEAARVAAQIVSVIRRLGRLRFAHGDLKATNFVITSDGPFLMDLDSLVQHRFSAPALRAHRADITRFLENWDDMPAVRALFGELQGRAARD